MRHPPGKFWGAFFYVYENLLLVMVSDSLVNFCLLYRSQYAIISAGDDFMKTIRLLYPDYLGGGLDTYYFGSNLLAHILPENDRQPLIRVNITAPCGKEYPITEGIYAKSEVLAGIRDAQSKIEIENPDRIITIGGNCLVSLAPFDYMHGKFKRAGIIWIDAHPDVSTVNDGYPNAHARTCYGFRGIARTR